jgi:hypothetical protein
MNSFSVLLLYTYIYGTYIGFPRRNSKDVTAVISDMLYRAISE